MTLVEHTKEMRLIIDCMNDFAEDDVTPTAKQMKITVNESKTVENTDIKSFDVSSMLSLASFILFLLAGCVCFALLHL